MLSSGPNTEARVAKVGRYYITRYKGPKSGMHYIIRDLNHTVLYYLG